MKRAMAASIPARGELTRAPYRLKKRRDSLKTGCEVAAGKNPFAPSNRNRLFDGDWPPALCKPLQMSIYRQLIVSPLGDISGTLNAEYDSLTERAESI
jgi:hypothetical protein